MFPLEHFGGYTCGVPDGDTIVLTGGFTHNYVTRWEKKVNMVEISVMLILIMIMIFMILEVIR